MLFHLFLKIEPRCYNFFKCYNSFLSKISLVSAENAKSPLKETKPGVQISGAIAHVQTTQVYQNLGTEPIEAKYVFPLSTRAAVHKMKMTIGNCVINAKIFER